MTLGHISAKDIINAIHQIIVVVNTFWLKTCNQYHKCSENASVELYCQEA